MLNDESTRSAAEGWADGDQLIILFYPYKYSYTNLGIATYSKGEWNLELRGDSETLPITNEEKCVITYVRGNYSIDYDREVIILNDECCIYQCETKTAEYGDDETNSRYTMTSSGDLYISGEFYPQLSRFRIKGIQDEDYEVKGLNWREGECYLWSSALWPDENNDAFMDETTSESRILKCEIAEDGEYYTPYIYGDSRGSGPFKIKKSDIIYAYDHPLENGNSYEILDPELSKSNNWISEKYIRKYFSISRTEVTGMVNLYDYELIDLKAELSSTIGISAEGYIPCTTIDESEDSRVLFTFASRYGHESIVEPYFTTMLLDTDKYSDKYNPYFKAYVYDSPFGYSTDYRLYVYGKNAYVGNSSYVYLSNF